MIVTDRLFFRAFRPADAAFYQRLTGDEQVMKYIAGRRLTPQEAETELQRLISGYQKHPGFRVNFFAFFLCAGREI